MYSYIFTFTGPAGRIPLSPEKHMLTFLWFVGHQSSSYRDVADRFGITLSALFDIITRVANFLISIAPTVIKYPNSNEKKQTSEYFFQTKKIPKVIGKHQYLLGRIGVLGSLEFFHLFQKNP